MKGLLKKITPTLFLNFYTKKRYNKNQSKYIGKDINTVFTEIYEANVWGNNESVSGVGSTIANTSKIIAELNVVLPRLKVKSMFDIPCGDFNWAQHLNLTSIEYTGADIVTNLIQRNNKTYSNSNIEFRVQNLIAESIPKSDLVLVRDCFVHFSYDDILKSLKNIVASQSEYLMTTNFSKQNLNFDIATGDWRCINLEKPPFNFPKPMLEIEEHFHPKYKKEAKGKCLAIWKINELKSLFE